MCFKLVCILFQLSVQCKRNAYRVLSMCEVFSSPLMPNGEWCYLRIFLWHLCCSSARLFRLGKHKKKRVSQSNTTSSKRLMFIKGEKWAHRQKLLNRIATHKTIKCVVSIQYGLHVNEILLLYILHPPCISPACFISIQVACRIFILSRVLSGYNVRCIHIYFIILTSTNVRMIYLKTLKCSNGPCLHCIKRARSESAQHWESWIQIKGERVNEWTSERETKNREKMTTRTIRTEE